MLQTAIILTVIATFTGLCSFYAVYIERLWIRVAYVKLSPAPSLRLIHITDIHFKGDRNYLEKVVQKINQTDADMVCFTGDLIEDSGFLKGALEILSKINKPLYGVPGNHDKWTLRSFDELRKTFQGTGGEWIDYKPVIIPSKKVALLPLAACKVPVPQDYKKVFLEHYPEVIEQIRGARFDLKLAGHTHGGQIRIPFLSRLFLDLGPYDKGLFQTPSGPLYVNPGIGTFHINARFLCRPEITVIDL